MSYFTESKPYIINNNKYHRFDWLQNIYYPADYEQKILISKNEEKFYTTLEKQFENKLSSNEYPVINEALMDKNELTILKKELKQFKDNHHKSTKTEIINDNIDKQIDDCISVIEQKNIKIHNIELFKRDMKTFFYVFSQ